MAMAEAILGLRPEVLAGPAPVADAGEVTVGEGVTRVVEEPEFIGLRFP